MVCPCSCLYNYIVDIVFHLFMQHVGEDILHCSLIYSSYILQTKWHNYVVIYSHLCVKCHLFFIFKGHRDLIVPSKPIHKKEHLSPHYIVKKKI